MADQTIFQEIGSFLLAKCPGSSPLLLALSGGPDSLCLFYALVFFRTHYHIPFHVAHVDHSWREESSKEAEALKQLAAHYEVPFHLTVLDPSQLTGNLEAACREARYAFFAQLSRIIPFQGVLTGHHRGDLSETVFKRIAEGAHWSAWCGLQSETKMHGIRILRPLLKWNKSALRECISKADFLPFEDSTNCDQRFLRARLRENILPFLNQTFGKNIEDSLATLGQEGEELTQYFDAKLTPLLSLVVMGPFGTYLDLTDHLPASLLEIKYLIRLLCKQRHFFLSREMVSQAAFALQANHANCLFEIRGHQVRVDRRRIFVMKSLKDCIATNWKWTIDEMVYSGEENSSWKEGWQGELIAYLPICKPVMVFLPLESVENLRTIKRKWSKAKVPSFLYPFFPLILDEKRICHEFLTRRSSCFLEKGEKCLKIRACHL